MHRPLVLSTIFLLAIPLRAQTIPGYSPQSATVDRAAEADVITRPAPANAPIHTRLLSLQPHMAGTPAQEPTRDHARTQIKPPGLETEGRSHSPTMPKPASARP